MTTLTEAQVTLARTWIGTAETIEVLQERFDRLGTLDGAILESMRAQLVVLSGTPSSFSTPSGYSQNTAENIRILERLIAKFTTIGGTDGLPDAGSMRVLPMVRADYR